MSTLAEALAAYDEAAAGCPFNQPRPPRSSVLCPRCGASQSQNCGVEVTAAGEIIKAVRAIVAAPSAPSGEAEG